MGYTEDSSQVKVEIFKERGKWYTTVALKWDRYESTDKDGNTELIHDTFRRCLKEQYPGSWIGMWAICMKPYHEHKHPLMIMI